MKTIIFSSATAAGLLLFSAVSMLPGTVSADGTHVHSADEKKTKKKTDKKTQNKATRSAAKKHKADTHTHTHAKTEKQKPATAPGKKTRRSAGPAGKKPAQRHMVRKNKTRHRVHKRGRIRPAKRCRHRHHKKYVVKRQHRSVYLYHTPDVPPLLGYLDSDDVYEDHDFDHFADEHYDHF